LAPLANRSIYEDLVDEYLSIPPLNGDPIRDIEEKFNRITSRNLKQIRNTIPGLGRPISRGEVDEIERKLATRKNVVITGEAGVGKSGLIPSLVKNGEALGKKSFLLDARLLGSINSNTDLRNLFDIKGPPHIAIKRLGQHIGCRFIIDQLDNIAGLPSSNVILDLIYDIGSESSGVEIITVCRNKEPHEQDILRRLLLQNFVEVICRQITKGDAKQVLSSIGINDSSVEMIEFCTNLLNLELAGEIRKQEPNFNFSILTDEVHLWEKYIEVWHLSEGRDLGEEMLSTAIGLAKLGLNDPEGMFKIKFPQPPPLQRLISWGIILQIEGQIYRFRHEKFQDFIYAKHAADCWLKPEEILNEILEHKSRNIFRWVEQIYRHNGSPRRIEFLKEVFDV
jgi:hypothetical protein